MSDFMLPVQTRYVDGLEVLFALPPENAPRRETPLLFLHGAFAGAWMWRDNFLPWFARRGYAGYALSMRGHGKSESDKDADYLSITDYVKDVETCIADLAEQGLSTPVLIGHSMGGFVAQKYIEQDYAPAVVLLCAVPPQGLLLSQLHIISTRPELLMELNQIFYGGDVSLATIQETLFAQPVETEILERFRAHMRPESQRAIWDMSLFNLPFFPHGERPPLLVLGAEKDLLVPDFLVEATAHTYGVPAQIFPGMGHAVTHEHDWPLVAATIADWLVSEAIL
ncbi:MAG: alpha/beta hydrolase [Zoogloeaceae bacterium]|jgi:non-heme chloroperoxidase|nr:alpha/beta hydrolase [Zoogloeaceae bacterium]